MKIDLLHCIWPGLKLSKDLQCLLGNYSYWKILKNYLENGVNFPVKNLGIDPLSKRNNTYYQKIWSQISKISWIINKVIQIRDKFLLDEPTKNYQFSEDISNQSKPSWNSWTVRYQWNWLICTKEESQVLFIFSQDKYLKIQSNQELIRQNLILLCLAI